MARYRNRGGGGSVDINTALANPHAGRFGATSTQVQALFRQRIRVTDFGADPTGVADSTTAFRNAMFAVMQRGTVASLSRSGVVIPYGNYKLSGTVPVLVGTGMIAEDKRGAVCTWYGPQTDPMFAVEGGRAVFDGITFQTSGGTAATGPSAYIQWYHTAIQTVDSRFGSGQFGFYGYAGHARITDCIFYRPFNHAVRIEHGSPGNLNWRPVQTSFELSHCDFFGRSFWFGGSEWTLINGGRFEWEPTGATDALFTSSGRLMLNDIVAISHAGPTPAVTQAWIQGNGVFQANRVRFGEYPRPYFAIRKEATIPTLPGAGEGTTIKLSGSMVAVDTDIAHFYDDVPMQTVIDKDNLLSPNGGFQGRGFWIHDDGSHTLLNAAMARQSKTAMMIDIDAWSVGVGDFLIRESAAPGDSPTVAANVTDLFRQYNKVPDRWHTGQAPRSAINYWFDGNFQTDGVVLNNAFTVISGSPTVATTQDTTSTPGYSINTYTYDTGPGEAAFGPANIVAWPPAAWTLAAGTYCFSIEVYANWSTEVGISVTKFPGLTTAPSWRGIIAQGAWRRIGATFNYNGTDGMKFTVQLANWCQVGQQCKFRFPMVTAGQEPPIDYSPPTESTNTLTAFTPRVIYGEGSPPASGGPYKRGDEWVNVKPAPGETKRAMCVADGSPGTWESV